MQILGSIVTFAEGAGAPGFLQFVPIILVFAIFYFLLIAPMRKRQKASAQTLVENLKKGDRVVTNGGLYGTVAGVEEKAVIVKVAENVKVKIAKSAVAGLADQEGTD